MWCAGDQFLHHNNPSAHAALYRNTSLQNANHYLPYSTLPMSGLTCLLLLLNLKFTNKGEAFSDDRYNQRKIKTCTWEVQSREFSQIISITAKLPDSLYHITMKLF
jgi:hypothetical protein